MIGISFAIILFFETGNSDLIFKKSEDIWGFNPTFVSRAFTFTTIFYFKFSKEVWTWSQDINKALLIL